MYLRDLQLQEDDFEVAIKVKNSSGALNFSVDSNSDSINGRISRKGGTKVWSQNHIYIKRSSIVWVQCNKHNQKYNLGINKQEKVFFISVEKRLASWHAGNHSGDSKAEIFQFAEFFSVVFNFFGNHLLGTWSFLCQVMPDSTPSGHNSKQR